MSIPPQAAKTSSTTTIFWWWLHPIGWALSNLKSIRFCLAQRRRSKTIVPRNSDFTSETFHFSNRISSCGLLRTSQTMNDPRRAGKRLRLPPCHQRRPEESRIRESKSQPIRKIRWRASSITPRMRSK